MTRSVWIEGHEGRYKIHDDGRVESFCRRRPRFLKTIINSYGYAAVEIYSAEYCKKTVRVHPLVAKYFVPGYKQGLQVNHKNGIKTDSRAENLEWVTPGENTRHAVSTGLRSTKPVIGTNIETGLAVKFKSAAVAVLHLGGHERDDDRISKCCLGKKKTYKGYRWSYA